jgi:hypothetical protein
MGCGMSKGSRDGDVAVKESNKKRRSLEGLEVTSADNMVAVSLVAGAATFVAGVVNVGE